MKCRRTSMQVLGWTDKRDDRPRPPRMKKPKVTPASHRVYTEYTQDLLHDILVDKYGTERGTLNFDYFVQKGGGAFYAVGQEIQDEKAQMFLDLGERPPSDYWSETYFDVWQRWMRRPASKQVEGSMNKTAVAKELVSIAKELSAVSRKADYGDTRMYLNVFDFFNVPTSTPATYVIPDLMDAVSEASLDEKRETVRRMIPRLKRNPIVQKHMKDWAVTFKV